MRVTVLLADAAQAVAGKLYVLGAGWTFIGPEVGPMALGLILEIPWTAANERHKAHVELQDPDGNPARLGPEGNPVSFDAELEVGRPAGHPAGAPFNVPLAVNIGALPLEPGKRYIWVVSVDGETRPEWQAGFQVRPPGTGPR